MTDPTNGEQIHKRKLISLINQGRSISKSTDRTHRVRGDTKHGKRGGSSSKQGSTAVIQAFNFGKEQVWIRAEDDLNLDSGADLLKADDFCLIVVRGKAPMGGRRSKKTFLLICKFMKFGEPGARVQQMPFWLREKKYSATVLVLPVKAYTDIQQGQCLQPIDDEELTVNHCELVGVDSSCILPVSPSEELVATEDSIVPSVKEFMRVADLKEAFNLILRRGKHHALKDIIVSPIKIDGEFLFVTSAEVTGSQEVIVCNICRPPRAITKPDDMMDHIQRVVRNHMAVHQWRNPEAMITNKPCGYCCQSCHSVVKIKDRQRVAIRDGAQVLASTIVRPNCQTYPSLGPFTYKFMKPLTVKYVCTNKLVFCDECDTFIWSYNLKKHFEVMHDGSMPESIKALLPKEAEMKYLEDLFNKKQL